MYTTPLTPGTIKITVTSTKNTNDPSVEGCNNDILNGILGLSTKKSATLTQMIKINTKEHGQ